MIPKGLWKEGLYQMGQSAKRAVTDFYKAAQKRTSDAVEAAKKALNKNDQPKP